MKPGVKKGKENQNLCNFLNFLCVAPQNWEMPCMAEDFNYFTAKISQICF